MLKIEPFHSSHIQLLLDNISRNQLSYHEYLFIDDYQLMELFNNKLIRNLSDINSIPYIAISNSRILGFINCEINQFDTANFGFDCYRISELLVFSDNYSEIKKVSTSLLESLEKKIGANKTTYYISISINNNNKNQDKILNSLIENRFYYIHTLLTFKSLKNRFNTSIFYPKENLTIRNAENNDVEQVSNLAEKSFKYSRFHLDPYLDNSKASGLLKQSAENSILKSFVDIMFVAEINKVIVGYYSAKKRYISEFDKTIGNAVISAVDLNYRGLGIFSKLDSHLLNWFADNTDFSEMGTYLANYPIHKTWINKELGLVRGSHQLSKFIK